MNPLDLFACSSLCFFVLLGLWNGLIRQVFSLGGLLAGSVLAVSLSEHVAPVVPVADPRMGHIVAFVGILFGCTALSWIAGHLLAKLTGGLALGWADRLAGGLLGCVKAGVAIAAVTLLLVSILPEGNPTLRGSATLPRILFATRKGLELMPGELRAQLVDKLPALKAFCQRR